MWPSLSLQNHICNRGTELTINVKRQKFEQATLCRQKEGAGSLGGERRCPGACGSQEAPFPSAPGGHTVSQPAAHIGALLKGKGFASKM